MARSRSLGAEAQAAHVLPAALGMGGDAGVAFDPGSHLAPSPDATFQRRSLKGLEEGVLKLSREERSSTRIVGAGIAQTSRSMLVVALNKDADPFAAQANQGSSIFGSMALGDQPQSVVASCLSNRFCRHVALAHLIQAEMRCQLCSSRHTRSIQQDLVLDVPDPGGILISARRQKIGNRKDLEHQVASLPAERWCC